MGVVIQDFEAVAEPQSEGEAKTKGKAAPSSAPVSMTTINRMLAQARARRMRLWAH